MHCFFDFFSFTTYKQLDSTQEQLKAPEEYLAKKQEEIKQAEDIFTKIVDSKKAAVKYQKQKEKTKNQKKNASMHLKQKKTVIIQNLLFSARRDRIISPARTNPLPTDILWELTRDIRVKPLT